ncbi:MAG: hypothetical protein ACKV2V_06785 [Blastocatellia bacterium]
MKYYRRFDLDQITRLQIAAQAIFALGVYGEMTRLARQYGISRTFAYQLMWQALAAFEPGLGRANGADFSQAWLDQCLLLLRLEGKCSLSQISHILSEMGAPRTSIGYLSERLAALLAAIVAQAADYSKITATDVEQVSKELSALGKIGSRILSLISAEATLGWKRRHRRHPAPARRSPSPMTFWRA